MAEPTSRFSKVVKLLGLLIVLVFLLAVTSAFQALKAVVSGGMSEQEERKPHITELRIDGPILSAQDYLASIRRVAKDEHCKGLLVRIESPGGAVGASQEIFHALENLRKSGLPVVVSQANIAASGGYYISLAGDRIFSNPGTLTGSIGVIFQFPEAEKLMAKIGVGMRTIKSGALKDVGNFAREATPAEVAYLQEVIQDVYSQFLTDILSRRPISRDSLLRVADGRVMTGQQALAWHLVDTLGGYEAARSYLAKKAQVDAQQDVKSEPPERKWYENLAESRSPTRIQGLAELASVAKAWLPELKPGLYFLMPSL